MKKRSGFKRMMAAVCFAALCLAQGAYATTTQIKLNTTYPGDIEDSNPSDRYTVELPTPCALEVNITTKAGDPTALPNGAAEIRWLNEDNSQIKTTTGGVNFPYTNENALEAGTYHIEIVQRSGNPAYVGIYNIKTTCYVNSIVTNNDMATAQPLTLGYTAKGTVQTGNTADWYKYVLTEPGVLKITGTSSQTTYIRLLNSSGTQIKSTTFSTSEYEDSTGLETGTYYIKIDQYSTSYTGTYNFRGDFIVAENSEEAGSPHNTTSNAQQLTFGQTINGLLSYQDDKDMYKYVLAEPGRLYINVNCENRIPGGAYYTYVRWYNSSGTQIKNTTCSRAYKDSLDLERGTYYIGIEKYDASYTGRYTLLGNFTAAGNNEAEYDEEGVNLNNTRTGAQVLENGQTVKGFISYQDGIDYYRYDLAQSDILTVNVNVGTDRTNGQIYEVNVALLNNNGTDNIAKKACYANNTSSSYNCNMSKSLTAGTYYIEITKYSDSYTGTYSITAWTGSTPPPPTVTSVSVSPSEVEDMRKGTTYSYFTATVTGDMNPSQAVTWSVSGNNKSGTTISSSSGYGILTIDPTETAETLTVTATSNVDPTKSSIAIVTVKSVDVTVTFSLDGGEGDTPPPPVTVTDGTTLITKPPTSGFTKTGYENDGEWYSDYYKTTKFVFGENGTPVTSDMTLSLKWIPIRTVTFDLNGGEGEVPDTVSVLEGNKVPIGKKPSTSGFTKEGFVVDSDWYITSTSQSSSYKFEFGESESGTTVYNDMTLYLKWIPIRTVTFDLNGGEGTAPDPVSVVSGSTVPIDQKPSTSGFTKTGYIADSTWWYDYSYYSNRFVFGEGGTTVSSDMTLYLKWIDSYLVTFDAKGGTVTPPSSYTNINNKLDELPIPTKENSVFEGWYTDEYYSSYYKVTLDKTYYVNTTIYANWRPIYTITFDPKGGTVEPTSSPTTTGSVLAELPTPTKENHVFDGWYTAETYLYYQKVTTSTMFEENTTIYAKWIPIYTITFDPKGGTVDPTSSTTTTGSVLAELPTPTRENYTFEGWFTNENYSSSSQVTTSTVFYENTTIYAKWGWKSIHTVHFNPNGGTVSPTSGGVGISGTLASLPTPTRTGHKFEGWFTAETDGDEVTLSTVFSEDTTIYAKWMPIYIVTFTYTTPNGSTITVATDTVSIGGTLSSLPTPNTRIGYAFNGWFMEETGGEQVTTSTVFTQNTTIYAHWTPLTYTIIYTPNGGILSTNPINYTIETEKITLQSPTKAGYTFTGWTGSNGTTPQKNISINKGSTGNKIYTANWTANTPIIPNRENPIIGQIGVQTIDNAILLSNLPSNAKVEVYNLQGKLIFSSGKSSNRENRGSDNLKILVQTGIYIVKIGTQTMRIAIP